MEIRNRAMSLEAMLASAKANRTDYIRKFEEEQKAHNETIQEMNKMRV